MTQSAIYWINGAFVSADHATLSITDVGILRGYGVFDYLRSYDGQPFHLMDHLKRLRSSADQIGLDMPYDLEDVADITHQLIEKNHDPNVGIRFVLTGGESTSSLIPDDKSSLAILIHPLSELPAVLYEQGAKLITSRLQREFPTVKSTNYIGAIMAMREAKKQGAVEALYVDNQNQISECTRSNFFTVNDGKIITPVENLLPGITRQVIMNYAAEIAPLELASVHLDDLVSVDEVFITSSTKEVLPITQIDDVVIGNGTVGPITRAVMARFSQETG
ncbi:MAG: aminotransferase class IV [Chloroflexota bacterium]